VFSRETTQIQENVNPGIEPKIGLRMNFFDRKWGILYNRTEAAPMIMGSLNDRTGEPWN